MLSVSSYVDGDAKWFFDDISVAQYENYTYAVKYKSDAAGTLGVRYTKTDGSYIYDWVASLPAVADWTEASGTMEVPAGVVSLTIFHTLNTAGTLSIDNAVLTKIDNSFANGMVTFALDDGWISQLQNAVPVLDANGIKGTFGLLTQGLQLAD
jgi:hypothetical protein